MEHRVIVTYTCPNEDEAEVLLDAWATAAPDVGAVMSYHASAALASIALATDATSPQHAIEKAMGLNHFHVRHAWEEQEGMWPDTIEVVATQAAAVDAADKLSM